MAILASNFDFWRIPANYQGPYKLRLELIFHLQIFWFCTYSGSEGMLKKLEIKLVVIAGRELKISKF